MIIVTGIGRSGTSALMLYARAVGMDIGNPPWRSKYRAGLELAEFRQINHGLYEHGLTAVLRARVESLRMDVVKDPLFIRDTSIIRHWWAVRQDIRVVYCHRSYAVIAASQARVPRQMAPAYRCNPDAMEKVETRFLKVCAELGVSTTVVHYPFRSHVVLDSALGVETDGMTFENVMR